MLLIMVGSLFTINASLLKKQNNVELLHCHDAIAQRFFI